MHCAALQAVNSFGFMQLTDKSAIINKFIGELLDFLAYSFFHTYGILVAKQKVFCYNVMRIGISANCTIYHGELGFSDIFQTFQVPGLLLQVKTM